MIAQRTQRSDSAPTRGRRRGDWVPSRALGKQVRAVVKARVCSQLAARVFIPKRTSWRSSDEGWDKHESAPAEGSIPVQGRSRSCRDDKRSGSCPNKFRYAMTRFRNASSPSNRQGGCYLSDGGNPTHGAATERAPEGARRGDGASAASGRCGRPGSDASRRATERSDGARGLG